MRRDRSRAETATSLGAALLALVALAGCADLAGQFRAARDAGTARAMYVAGFENIESVYIEPVEADDLAMAGLGGLSAIDPNLSVHRRDARLALLVNGRSASTLHVPAADNATVWGALTARAVDAARAASPLLRETPNEDIYEAVFAGVIGSLDGYSRYSSAESARENRASREGFGGIGVRIAVEDVGVRIVSVMHYTPAERAGLRADDLISHIDGQPAQDLDQQAAVDRLRGPVNSRVLLTVLRGGEEAPISVAVTRAHVVPESVTYRREGDFSYIRIYSFNLETGDSLRKEIANARDEIGKALRGYVLDLRGNPGGLLDQAVAAADLFLDRGRIVSTHGRHPDSHQFFEATPGDITEGLPIVVLINGNSASAAEIVAAALQDNGRAAVIGSNSYGKGTVQTVLTMPNEGELTLTWARFHAPSGYPLDRLGVLPTICTNDGAAADAARLLATLRAGDIRAVPTTLRNRADPRDVAALDGLRAACPVRRAEQPADLRLALDLLAEPTLYARAVHLADPPELAATGEAAPAPAQP
ncbi:MAG TPA: S41 family peptidase [Dongiaceae bacterium]|nr:S41 family peptidase [Dongiaceae bacterium]